MHQDQVQIGKGRQAPELLVFHPVARPEMMLQPILRCMHKRLNVSSWSTVQNHVIMFRGYHSWKASMRHTIRNTSRESIRRLLSTPPIEASERQTQRVVGWWLAGCCGVVAGAVLLGGVTRLTESGLSMTQWHLIKGMKPPRSEKEWEDEFERYKEFPEYKYIHQDLTLEGFKRIFYMEYAHRMWGRLTGLVIALPAAYFWARGKLGPSLKPRVAGYIGLVGLQGLLGWWMVKSGLKQQESPSDVPRVSQYRLAAHLGMALLIYSSMLYTALGLIAPPVIAKSSKGLTRLRHMAHGATAMVFFTAMSGAFVAGLDAGLVYNSFPKMGGQWIPDDIMTLVPKIKNFFENPTTVQFDHRLLGTVTLTFLFGTWALARGVALPRRARLAANCLAGMAFLQVSLGVLTLLYYVPTPLAASHQTGSVTLLSFALWLMSELRKSVPRL